MSEPIIQLNKLTKDYGQNRGVFDFNIAIQPGEVFGIVGVNGSGKTTTLRQMMGFLKPTSGSITIKGLDAWQDAAKLKHLIGYVPGEIAFPDTKSGTTFLKTQEKMLHMTSDQRSNQLIQDLKLDTEANIKRMSKGMKQKTALVEAFMADSEILLLDEPTTGLDPVMRDVFIELILDVKRRGKTVVMSSHMFNELEPTCDRIAFIQNGKLLEIIDQKKMAAIKATSNVTIEFANQKNYEEFIKTPLTLTEKNKKKNTVTLIQHEGSINKLFNQLKQFTIANISFVQRGLDEYFEEKLHLEEK